MGGPPGEEHLATAERAVAAMPESPEVWYELGDDHYHGGALQGMDDPLKRAAAEFSRALELDSSFAEPRMHLFEIAAAEGDTAEVRRLGSLVLAADSTNDFADYVRWQMAVTHHDTVALAALRARFDRMNGISLTQITLGARRPAPRWMTPAVPSPSCCGAPTPRRHAKARSPSGTCWR